MRREAPQNYGQIVDIRPKIHSLSDEALRNLAANAHRLEIQGTPTQRLQAHDLIPAIDAELYLRKATATKAAQPAKPLARKRK
jgi:hypothetical protein